MSAPEGNTSNGNGGILRGHGIAIAMIAIFAGMGLMFAFAASDGAIFGMNSSSSPYNNPANSSEGGPKVVSQGNFDEGSGERENSENVPENPESAPVPPKEESNVASIPQPDNSSTLSEEERQLLAISNYSWDSVAVKYASSSQDIMDLFGQQNFTRQKPADPGAEPMFMSDKVSVDVDRDRASEDEIISIETPVDTTSADADEAEEEQEENGTSGSDDEPQEEPIDEGDSGTGDNSTSTNSTSADSSDSGNSTSDDSGAEASVSIG